MINPAMHLNPDVLKKTVKLEPIRNGFGRGLVTAGTNNPAVVALCADLTDSTKMGDFKKAFPDRFVEIGIAEQNLVTVAAGMAAVGKVPFTSSYAAFSPGRNWEQIRTTICLAETNVKIVGSHAGLMTGPDGATHQVLEDIALMRVLPHMTVVVPADSVEAEKATLAMAGSRTPAYLRLARDKTPIVTTAETPFMLGKAYVLREGDDVTIVACGVMVHRALLAAELLAKKGIQAEVINCSTIKPLDSITLLKSIKKTGAVVTAEEHQITGGLGSAVAELVADHVPVPVRRVGVHDRFGESGTPEELLKAFGLEPKNVAEAAASAIDAKHVC